MASFLATVADGILFAALMQIGDADFLGGYWTGVSASLAAVLGGAIHFSLCRFWVFKRFDAPLESSIPRYILMSGTAAALHGVATQFFAGFLMAGFAWFASKALIYVAFTYPVSRYLVFEVAGDTSNPPGHSRE